MTRRRAWAGAALVALLALTGCANPAEKLAEKAMEKAIEDEVGQNAEVDLDSDGGSITNDDGSVAWGEAAEVPAGFPAELPLVDATLTMAIEDQGVFSLMYTVDDTAAFDELVAELEASGDLEKVSSMEVEGVTTYVYESAEWTVSVGLYGEEGEERSLSYMVSPKE